MEHLPLACGCPAQGYTARALGKAALFRTVQVRSEHGAPCAEVFRMVPTLLPHPAPRSERNTGHITDQEVRTRHIGGPITILLTHPPVRS